MCDNCSEARKVANQIAADLSSADKSREFYRRQGECREQERIIKLIEADCRKGLGDHIQGCTHEVMLKLIKGENK